MTVLAQLFHGLWSEKTVGCIAVKINPFPLCGYSWVPLMGVMTWRTWNISNGNQFPWYIAKNWKVIGFSFNVSSDIHNHFIPRMREDFRISIFCRTVLWMAGSAHRLHDAAAGIKILCPEQNLLFVAVNKMADAAHAWFKRGLVNDIFWKGCRYSKVMVCVFDKGFFRMAVITKFWGRWILES